MATWTTPKTDWVSSDYFNVADYNRIKENVLYLTELANELFSGFSPSSVVPTADKTVSDWYFATEFNGFEQRVRELYSFTMSKTWSARTFSANGAFINYSELNRLESAELDLYLNLKNIADGLRHLSFQLGLPNTPFNH